MTLVQAEPKKIYIRVDVQEWQPGANTKVYYNINDNDTNSTIYDLSGNGVNQTWNGTPGYATDATYGRVATFNGNSYTQAGSRVNFGNECTFIALFYRNNISSSMSIVTECASPSVYPIGINCMTANKYEGWYAGVYNSNAYVQSTSNAVANQRVMVATTRASDGTAKIYINGTLDNTVSGMITPTYSSGENLQIGRWRNRDAKYLNGQFKLFIGEDRTWTDAEVAALAAEYGF